MTSKLIDCDSSYLFTCKTLQCQRSRIYLITHWPLDTSILRLCTVRGRTVSGYLSVCVSRSRHLCQSHLTPMSIVWLSPNTDCRFTSASVNVRKVKLRADSKNTRHNSTDCLSAVTLSSGLLYSGRTRSRQPLTDLTHPT